MVKFLCAALTTLALADFSRAQISIDGSLVGDESGYGTALSIQNTNTQYGNATNGDPRIASSGSEIDQVFAQVADGRLNVLITGNLESNFNKLNVFIDSNPGGMNQIEGTSLPTQVDPFCCSGSGALQRFNGLRFDNGFEADHFLTFSNGNHIFGAGIDIWTLSAYYADLTQGTEGNKSEIGFQRFAAGVEPGFGIGVPIDQLNNGCTGPADTTCSPLEHEFAEPVDLINDPTNSRNHRNFLNNIDILMAIDNSNTAGVNGGSGAATGNPQSVLTGIEFSLPLAVLGNPTSAIKLLAFIGNGAHNHVSNQFSGVGVLLGNLGSPGSVNLANIAGNQFVTIPISPADFDGDGDVDGRDFLLWQRGGSPAELGPADLALWQAQYASVGGAPPSATRVPEPYFISWVILGLWPIRLGPRRF
ncbi:hypothetical protein [Bythopirellula polymerisocia]|uniref:Uncharacterized protein n=1 Tax=Bythopirellula polymerisocia TaxID=2528003 RepID=A0A5C6D032_9BACT|nr:hypothetical protein [Bythopirellula polymerisocia]TWU28279.1 hypothetical protein Pla144_15660 [Bythopirellula polymerisocia]